jgi:hypothetical protein
MVVLEVGHGLAIEPEILSVNRKGLEDVLHKNIGEAVIALSDRDILDLISHLHRLEAACCRVGSDTLVQRRLVEQRPLTRQGCKRKSRFRSKKRRKRGRVAK